MPRGKSSSTESTATKEPVMTVEDEIKTKNTNTKVTLVKPMKMDEIEIADENKPSETEAAVVAAPKKPRPKVGRSTTTRKKKTDGAGAKTAEKTEKESKPAQEKKPSKPRAKKKPVKSEAASAEVNKDEATDAFAVKRAEASAVYDSGKDTLSDVSLVDAQDEIEPEAQKAMFTRNERPEDLKFSLFLIVLFISVLFGLAYMFNNGNHKAKALIAAASARISHQPAGSEGTDTSAEPALPSPPDALPTSQRPPMIDATPAPPLPPVAQPATAPAVPKPPVAELPPAPPAPSATETTIAPEGKATEAISAPVTPVTTDAVAPLPIPPKAVPADIQAMVTPAAAPAPVAVAPAAPAKPASVRKVSIVPEAGLDAAAVKAKASSQKELLSIIDKN